MSAYALNLYEQLSEAVDEKTRSRLIVQALSELDERYPDLKDMVTRQNLGETELRLKKDIEEIRLEIEKSRTETKALETALHKGVDATRIELKQIEADLQKEIGATRLEIKQLEVNLQKEMRQIEARLQQEIEVTRLEIKQLEVSLQKEMR
ncbi:hypothetical protein FJZ55_10670, partial [Candidatus Woesearchaeota archaeon]|nr:hypothetical protein [Candidatus Woesearchaeota archaeon]